MNARAIWQGKLLIAKREVPVKLYSAVLDRQIDFHLLHKRDRTRVQQRMVDAETEKPVSSEENGVFEAGPGVYVTVTAEEIERSVPEASREVRVNRFVGRGAIDPQLFDRPYYLSDRMRTARKTTLRWPGDEKKNRAGIASWACASIRTWVPYSPSGIPDVDHAAPRGRGDSRELARASARTALDARGKGDGDQAHRCACGGV